MNLLQKSTASIEQCRSIWRYLREGGAANAREMFRYLWHSFLGGAQAALPARPVHFRENLGTGPDLGLFPGKGG